MITSIPWEKRLHKVGDFHSYRAYLGNISFMAYPQKTGHGTYKGIMQYDAKYVEYDYKLSFNELEQVFIAAYNGPIMDRIERRALTLDHDSIIRDKRGGALWRVVALQHGVTSRESYAPGEGVGIGEVPTCHTFGRSLSRVQVEEVDGNRSMQLGRTDLNNFYMYRPQPRGNLWCALCNNVGTIESLGFVHIRSLGFRCGPCLDNYLDNEIQFVSDRYDP